MAEVRSTYRVQLHAGFTFDDAAAILPYLAELGVTHVYCSPYLKARPGSTHGYDVVDHRVVNPELGGEDGLIRFVAALRDAGLGHIADIVPNHMAIAGRANPWWWDVLKRGQESAYAGYFDIDWAPGDRRLGGRILAPILGDHYGRELARGAIRIAWSEGEPIFTYYDNELPLSDETAAAVADQDYDVINADPDWMHDLLERQHYRLAFWKTAGQDLPYRRFFAINELVALRVDRSDVFGAVHERIFRLLHEEQLDGIRVDHIDGLRDPAAYLERLREHVGDRYVVVEKILDADERLPAWPVEGTTGYDFLRLVDGLSIDPAGAGPATELYESFTGASSDLEEETFQGKALLLSTELGSDLERLADIFVRLCEKRLEFRDFTRSELRDAIEIVALLFPVYRTYVTETHGPSDQDARAIRTAIEGARKRRDDLDPEVFDLLENVLLMRYTDGSASALALRFQQLTGPVMAKGLEDTVFYRFPRSLVLNEVGGDPGRFGVSTEEFHQANAERLDRWPYAMLASSTHDTKRSEDVRARMALLSEIPERWGSAVRRWCAMNERHRRGDMPDRKAEYLLYQTLVGAWPLTRDRAVAFMHKAAKEAKAHTSWIAPNEDYEAALADFVSSVMSDGTFLSDVESFVIPLVEPGRINSLAASLLKLTCPGVGDIYQGCELWNLSLVDPDNRRPVDYGFRRELSAAMSDASPEEAWARVDDGAPKIFLIQHALRTRSALAAAFGPKGTYAPLEVTGERAANVVAFRRGDDVAVVVPRLVMGVGRTWGGGPLTREDHEAWTDWADTVVHFGPGDWTNVLTDEDFGDATNVSFLFERFPVALLVRGA